MIKSQKYSTTYFILLHIFVFIFIPLDNNFTGMMNYHPILISIWALSSTAYILNNLYKLSSFNIHAKLSSCIIIVLCILTLVIPYNPIAHPLLSSIHLAVAYTFFFSISILFLISLFRIQFTQPRLFQKIIQIFIFFSFLAALCFMINLAITTLFEIIYAINLSICSSILSNQSK